MDTHPDMDRRPILRTLGRLSIPIFLGMIFQILYGIVDTFWIGRIDPGDPSYLGGVGVIVPLFFLVIALGSGVLIGVSSLVARSIGSKDRYTIDRVFASGLLIGGGLAFLLVIASYVFAEHIVEALGARGEYARHALEYLRFIIPAGALMLLGNVFNGIIMGEGRMKQIMIAAMIATVMNCGLDPLFIFTLGLGVRGAGLATVASQLLAGVYILSLFMRRRTVTPLGFVRDGACMGVVKRIAAVGFPQAAGQLAFAIGYFFFNRILIDIDPRAVAAFAVCTRFEQIILMPILSIGTAVITMVGQNFGAARYGRVLIIWRTALFLELVLVSTVVVFLVSVAPRLFPLFSDVAELTGYAVRQTRIITPSYLPVAIVILVRTFFQGLGKPLPGVVGNLLRSLVIAVPSALLYTRVMDCGVAGVWFGIVTANALAAGVSLIWVYRALKLLNRMQPQE